MAAALFALLLVVVPPTSARADMGCPGDCNQSGLVDVADLLTTPCPAADLDGDGTVTFDEKLSAIRQLLSGCPVPPQQRIQNVQRVLYPLTRLPLLELLFGLAIGSAGTSDNCGRGGDYTSSCQSLNDERIGIRLSAHQCSDNAPEGPASVDGEVTLRGSGFCPYFIVPGSMSIDFLATTRVDDDSGQLLFSSAIDATSHVASINFDRPPCRVRGGSGSINGSITYDGMAGFARIDTQDLHIRFQLSQFQLDPICDPGTIMAVIDGSLSISDEGPLAPLPATLHLTVTRHRTTATVDIDGTVIADALAGEAQLRSIEPLVADLSHRVPTAGLLELRSGGEVLRLRFHDDGIATYEP